MISEGITVEGGATTSIIRLLPTGLIEVFYDSTRDPLATPGWTRLECSSIVSAGEDPLGTPIFFWGDCGEPEMLQGVPYRRPKGAAVGRGFTAKRMVRPAVGR
jgi:hypothetical protein